MTRKELYENELQMDYFSDNYIRLKRSLLKKLLCYERALDFLD